MSTDRLKILDWPEGAPLVSSARRGALSFPVRVKASGEMSPVQELSVKSIAATDGRAKGAPAPSAASARFAMRGSGERGLGDVSLTLDRNMAPGTYRATLDVAGTEHTVSFEVVPDTSLRIRPSLVVLDAAEGNDASAIVGVENRGNVPLTIDFAGDYPLGREEPLAADPGDAASALDVLTAALSRAPRVLTEVGALHVEQPDGALLLAPGATATVRLTASWDHPLDQARRYRAFLPTYGSDVAIAIVTAAKRDSTTPVRKDTQARRPKSKRS